MDEIACKEAQKEQSDLSILEKDINSLEKSILSLNDKAEDVLDNIRTKGVTSETECVDKMAEAPKNRIVSLSVTINTMDKKITHTFEALNKIMSIVGT